MTTETLAKTSYESQDVNVLVRIMDIPRLASSVLENIFDECPTASLRKLHFDFSVTRGGTGRSRISGSFRAIFT